MTNPVPRRRQPWGAVLTAAPWDGRPVVAEPLRIPATAASPVPAADRAAPPSRRRIAFGMLLANAPWTGVSPAVDHSARTPIHMMGLEASDQDTILEVVE